MLLYALGFIGGPELNPTMHRSEIVACSGPLRKALEGSSARTAAIRVRASVVNAGTVPLGGSTTNEVRFSARLAPASYHPSPYADSILPSSDPSHFTNRHPPEGRFFRNAAASASVSTGLS